MRVRQGKQFPVTGHRDSGIKLWKTAVSDRRRRVREEHVTAVINH